MIGNYESALRILSKVLKIRSSQNRKELKIAPVSEMLRGEKTGAFWLGLIIFALSICFLFAIFWYIFVLSLYLDWRYWAPEIFGGVVFLIVGLLMMKFGVKREKKETSGNTKLL
jgi:uncharacterized integral membrane protein